MRPYFWPVLLLLNIAGAAQQPPPTLSTSDRVAIQSLEEKKSEAQKAYTDASQVEQAIIAEWVKSHPGYHINPQNFAVEADPKPAAKVEKPKETK